MSGFPLYRFAIVLFVVADIAVAADISDGALIEEVVVTASFRDEALAVAPMSVSVVSGEAILKRGAQHLEQLLNMTPNVNYAAGASRGRFLQVRGVGERSQFKDPLDPSVGLVVDGIDELDVDSHAVSGPLNPAF